MAQIGFGKRLAAEWLGTMLLVATVVGFCPPEILTSLASDGVCLNVTVLTALPSLIVIVLSPKSPPDASITPEVVPSSAKTSKVSETTVESILVISILVFL